MTVCVIEAPFLLVMQDLVSLGGILEIFLGFLIPRIAVGMAFQCDLAVGFLDLFFARTP